MTCGDTNGDENTVAVGLQIMGTIMVITASFISTFGVNLQKWAHNKNTEIPLEERKPMMKNWRWWTGMVCMITGSLFDLAALPFVPQSRVAALGAVGIVANVIVTPLFLGEEVTRHDIVGCVVVCVGCTIACVFGAATEPEIDSSCLLDYFAAGLFIFYAVSLVASLLVMYYLIHGFQVVVARLVEAEECPNDTFDCVWAHRNRGTCEKYTDDMWPFCYITKYGAQFYPFLVAAFGGMCGANSIMFAKAVLIFLKNAASGDASSAGYLMLFLIPFGACLFLQVTFLNKSLQIYPDALFVLPCYQSFWIVFGIAAGLIFYKEYQQLEGWHIFLFALGVIISLVGVKILAMRNSKTDKDDLDEDDTGYTEYADLTREWIPHRTLTKYFGDDIPHDLDQPLTEAGASYQPPSHIHSDLDSMDQEEEKKRMDSSNLVAL